MRTLGVGREAVREALRELGADAGERLRAAPTTRVSRLEEALRRCPQCWKKKPRFAFIAKDDGKVFRMCNPCRERYRGWTKKTLEEKLALAPPREDPAPTGRVRFVRSSHNEKLGGIPASWSERGTCPPSCGLYEAGCYAAYGKLGSHWRSVPEQGLTWEAFLEAVRALPTGQLWRHNVAGDLAGQGEDLDVAKLGELVEASEGRRGFTFTHKTTEQAWAAYHWAGTRGFTINLSCDTLDQADACAWALELLGEEVPLVVLLPHDAPDAGVRTPQGRRVVVCPAETRGLTCAECQLCAHPGRASIVGFRAHGQFKKHVPELVQLRRKGATS